MIGAMNGGGTAASPLEAALLAEIDGVIDKWQRRYADRPEEQRTRLLLLAMEREQVVAVAYREEAVAARVAELEVDEDVRALIRQTLVWVWKDEQLHAEYLRGQLLRTGGVLSSLLVYGHQLQGALSGWTAATRHLRAPHAARLPNAAAAALVLAAGVAGLVPTALRRELRYQTFRRYCDLNAAIEASAESAYRRLVQVAATAEDADTFERIRADEARHGAAFRLLAASLTEDDHLVAGLSADELADRLGGISRWFLPAARRTHASVERSFGSRRPVAVGSGRHDTDKVAALEDVLDRSGLAAMARTARTAAVRVSFMLGYDRNDRSNVNDPELVDALAGYLRRHGVEDVAVLEAPTVYGGIFAHRSVPEVARYLGFDAPSYRIVDMGADLRPFRFDRGYAQRAISATWADADLRIVMPKMRTDPVDYAHVSLSTLEGSTGTISDTVYAGRAVDYRSATMMLLDVAPPDFSVVDCWAPVADGPFGVMACRHPADVRHLYAGADALSVDEVVLADLGITDPRRSPGVARAYHWFGLAPAVIPVDGDRPALATELRGAHASPWLRALGALSYPVYVYLSRDGQLFVPAMDTRAFPPWHRPAPAVRAVRWLSQRAFGLYAPPTAPPSVAPPPVAPPPAPPGPRVARSSLESARRRRTGGTSATTTPSRAEPAAATTIQSKGAGGHGRNVS
jgi:hypothetical protein